MWAAIMCVLFQRIWISISYIGSYILQLWGLRQSLYFLQSMQCKLPTNILNDRAFFRSKWTVEKKIMSANIAHIVVASGWNITTESLESWISSV